MRILIYVKQIQDVYKHALVNVLLQHVSLSEENERDPKIEGHMLPDPNKAKK